MQPPRPEVGENLIGLEVEQLWIFEEEDGSKVSQWCQGLVVAVKEARCTFNGMRIACARVIYQSQRKC